MADWFEIVVGLSIAGIVVALGAFLYATYVGLFEPLFVSAIATSGLVLVTAISVVTTISLLKEQQRGREQQITPCFKLETTGIGVGRSGIIARNIGNGPAKNIDIDISIHPQDLDGNKTYPNVASGDILPIGNPFDDVDLDDVEEIKISGKCEDILGNEHTIEDKHRTRQRSTAEIIMGRDTETKHLKDIADNLADIESRLKRLER